MSNEASMSDVVIKMIPTGSVSVATLYGIPLQDWTYVVAILVGVVQVAYTLFCFYKRVVDKNKQED